jgi:photosystem II stability/assembly factor-like uncharacterized protein
LLLGITAAALHAQEAGIPLKGEELFGSLRARQIGPALMSGRVSDIEGHPTDPKVLYIASGGGGIWKSTDGGVVFRSVFDKHAQSVGALAIDPQQPDKIVWAGTGEVWTRNSVSVGDGLYKTEDAGENWKRMGFEKSERISSVKVHPKNSNVVYVGVLGPLWSAGTERGVYKTTDGGATWSQLLYVDENTGCSELVLDPSNPDILYAAFWEFRRTAWSFSSGGLKSALFKSVDGGKTWNKIHKGFPEGKLGRIAVAVAPSKPSTLYAVIESEKPEQKGMYRSDDGGTTWAFTNGDFELSVRPFYFSRIVVDPTNHEVVYKAGLSGSVSKDGGKTFKNLGSMHSDIHDFWVHVQNPDMLFVATDGGLYRSWDGGTVLEMVKNLPLSQFYHVSVDNATPYQVYGGLQDNGSWYGPSESPGGIENRDWFSVGYGDGFRVYRHPTKANIVYSEMQGAENIWRYDTEKRQSKIIKPYPVKGDPKLRFNWNTPIQISKHKPDRLYVGSQFLHRSDDMGESWVKLSPDLTTNDKTKQQQENSGGLSMDNSGAENHCTIFTIAESPLDEAVLWVGTDDGNLQVTSNGGKTWTNVALNLSGVPKNTWVYHVEPSVFDKNTCYVVLEGHTRGDMMPYAYKTTDLGKTWKSIVSSDVKGFARSIKEDIENPNLLFLGTEMGLFVTVDGGINWSQFTNNMPAAAVHFIALEPRRSDLVLATHGRGVIIIDDISPLRQITPAVIEKPLHFFSTKPTMLDDETPFAEGGDAGQFVGPNPDNRAKIIYYLKSRHTFGKMTLEVLNKEGKQVADLTPGKSKGINIVYWGYTLKSPKVAKGKTFAFGGFAQPRLTEGVYTVRLTKGKEVFETTLELAPDPNSMHSSQDRKNQFDATMKLYNMTEQLAYDVDRIDAMSEAIASAVKQQPSMKKTLDPFHNKLQRLKDSLVVMKGDNYVGSAEPMLREKISGLYSEVASYYGSPTAAQMENLALLETRQNESRKNVEAFVGKELPELNKKLIAAKQSEIKLRSFEAFKEAEK